MVIGMGYDSQDPAAKAEVYQKVQEFTQRFRERHHAINCRDLLGCDVSSVEGKAIMKAGNFRETRCALFVKDAVAIIEEILVP
jgi:hypothetical protein